MAKKFSFEWWAELRPEQTGKETEKLVEAVLVEMNQRQDFAWHRMPDAKAARGLINAQPADYLISNAGSPCFLEVKALKHEFRLPKDRVTQLPTLKKFEMAGFTGFVLVHHFLEGVWRVARCTDLFDGAPSWDLRRCAAMFTSPADALRFMGLSK